MCGVVIRLAFRHKSIAWCAWTACAAQSIVFGPASVDRSRQALELMIVPNDAASYNFQVEGALWRRYRKPQMEDR